VATVLPELDVEKVRRWCRERVSSKFADEVRLEVTARGKSVSIYECRPIWKGAPAEWTKMAIVQIRYQGDDTWNFYFGDRNGKWVEYFDLDTNQPIGVILDELGLDPTCVFWG
jgi:hypothetical protein